MSTLNEKYLGERARRGDRTKFAAVLAKIPDVAPIPGDELPLMARDAIDHGRPTPKAIPRAQPAHGRKTRAGSSRKRRP